MKCENCGHDPYSPSSIERRIKVTEAAFKEVVSTLRGKELLVELAHRKPSASDASESGVVVFLDGDGRPWHGYHDQIAPDNVYWIGWRDWLAATKDVDAFVSHLK